MTIQWFHKLRRDNTRHSCERVELPLLSLIRFCKYTRSDSGHFERDVYIINNVIYIALTWQ